MKVATENLTHEEIRELSRHLPPNDKLHDSVRMALANCYRGADKWQLSKESLTL